MNHTQYIPEESPKISFTYGLHLRDKATGELYFIGKSDNKIGVISMRTGIACKVIDIQRGKIEEQISDLIKEGYFDVLNSGEIKLVGDINATKLQVGYLLINTNTASRPITVCMVCNLGGVYSLICIDDGNRYFGDSNSIDELFHKIVKCRFKFSTLHDTIILDCRKRRLQSLSQVK